jgi:DNA-binding response OmpR family regulator
VPAPIKVIAILAANPALTSLLSAVLAATYGLRVRSFESAVALTTYMRLSPVDLLVCDFDCAASPADDLARALRGDTSLARRDFQIIALASVIDAGMKVASIASGIDEVIVKPMSPKYLLERVLSRLRPAGPPVGTATRYGPERRGSPSPARPAEPRPSYAGRGDNVIPLFRHPPLPAHRV